MRLGLVRFPTNRRVHLSLLGTYDILYRFIP
jgi:hypothetical protein